MLDRLRGFLEHADDAIDALDLDLVDASVDLGDVLRTLGLEAVPELRILDRHRGVRVVDAVEAARGEAGLGERPLPCREG